MRLRIEKLAREHAVDAFDCGNVPLNQFPQRHALTSQQSNAAVTYLGLADASIIDVICQDPAAELRPALTRAAV